MRGRARNTDPETSQAAAKTNFNSAGIEVLRCCLRRRDEGANWYEAWIDTGMPRQTISPRWTELMKAGMIERRRNEKGKLITRPGESGTRQSVHWITKDGVKWLDIEDSVLGPAPERQ